MEVLKKVFAERIEEVEAYVELLEAIELQVRTGPPRIGGSGAIITTTQQRILYSSVYLQLYNLVEVTVTKCLAAISNAVTSDGRWKPSDLSDNLRKEWVRHLVGTHTDMGYEGRLKNSLVMCDHLIQALPVFKLDIEKGGGGNWDDQEIYRLATRIGCKLTLTAECQEGVKRPFKDEKGALELIVKLRNDLAHGSVSFGQCSEGVTAAELRTLTDLTRNYLQEVLTSFCEFVDKHSFLQPTSRPTAVQA